MATPIINAQLTAIENAIRSIPTNGVEEAVAKWLEDHPQATTTVQDFSLTNQKLVKGTLGFVIPQMYGAKGDGETDDTEAIQDCIEENNYVFFPNGTYLINGDVCLTLHSNLVIELADNAIIKRVNTSSTTKNKHMILIEDVENVVVKGGYIVGDTNIVPKQTATDGPGHGIAIRHSANIKVVDVDISYGTDGIGIGAGTLHSANISVKGCHLHHNQRHGISVTGVNGCLIDNCDIHDVYWLDGIDFETGYAEYPNANCTVTNTNIHDLNGIYNAVQIGIMNHDCGGLIVDNCYLSGLNLEATLPAAVVKNSTLLDIAYKKKPSNGITIIENCSINRILLHKTAGEIHFIGCQVLPMNNRTSAVVTTDSASSASADPTLEVLFENVHFESGYVYASIDDELFYTSYIAKKCTMNNCSIKINNNMTQIFHCIASQECVIRNCVVTYNSDVTNAGGLIISEIIPKCVVDNCIFDLRNINSTTRSYIFMFNCINLLFTNNSILTATRLGAYTYLGRITVDATRDVTFVGNFAPDYSGMSNTMEGTTIKQANNTLSGDLT